MRDIQIRDGQGWLQGWLTVQIGDKSIILCSGRYGQPLTWSLLDLDSSNLVSQIKIIIEERPRTRQKSKEVLITAKWYTKLFSYNEQMGWLKATFRKPLRSFSESTLLNYNRLINLPWFTKLSTRITRLRICNYKVTWIWICQSSRSELLQKSQRNLLIFSKVANAITLSQVYSFQPS